MANAKFRLRGDAVLGEHQDPQGPQPTQPSVGGPVGPVGDSAAWEAVLDRIGMQKLCIRTFQQVTTCSSLQKPPEESWKVLRTSLDAEGEI